MTTQAFNPKSGERKERSVYIVRKLFLLTMAVSLILAACSTNQPEISVEEISFSFGDVVNGQVAVKDLAVWNSGGSNLVIEAVTSSCGCTKATMDAKVISPGESSSLLIEFDSGAHGPDANGEIIRQIFIASNDPKQQEIVIEFQANVLPAN